MKKKIIRFYQADLPREIVATGLTLEEAQEHCQGWDSSSRTCTTDEGIARTAEKGAWFEGYDDE